MMDVMIAGNEYLAGYARRYCKKVHILPTGLDTQHIRCMVCEKDPNEIRLVWIGSESTLKYLAELRPVLEQIGKTHENVVLRIIADKFFDLEHMSVQKNLWSIDKQVFDLVECDIGLSPLPDNRFTRGKCGFKILQYFAAGLPVIASPVGVNEKFIKESNAGLLALTFSEWKDAIEKMVKGIAVYRQLGQNGEEYVQAYDRSVISKELCSIIKSVCCFAVIALIIKYTKEVPWSISNDLLEILACPKCKGEIYLNKTQDGLICDKCKLMYEIRDDIPIMLIEEAKPIRD
jgi:uncharacterized protein YbaR (Trm112 family)/glycosyltransferase involved in cell wall biosynthesis